MSNKFFLFHFQEPARGYVLKCLDDTGLVCPADQEGGCRDDEVALAIIFRLGRFTGDRYPCQDGKSDRGTFIGLALGAGPGIVTHDEAAAVFGRPENMSVAFIGADDPVVIVGYADGNDIVEYVVQPGFRVFQSVHVEGDDEAETEKQADSGEADQEFMARDVRYQQGPERKPAPGEKRDSQKPSRVSRRKSQQ